jgi:BirA family biotin operon repressor/biotin-[acetyl-CoA-carboxylase] ligase
VFEDGIRAALRELPLGGLRVFESVGSTNDEALAWAGDDARDLSLVVADEQTFGRGRSGKTWLTPPGSALAFSLILRQVPGEDAPETRLTGLGAIAVAQALKALGLAPAIKWPNDVLLGGKKSAGILVETTWTGEVLEAAVLGVGVNVLRNSAPPAEVVDYPATSVEAELGRTPDRAELLREILSAIFQWRNRLASDELLAAWQQLLAFRNESVFVTQDGREAISGILARLQPDGSLVLETESGPRIIHMGEIHVRPANDRIH